MRKKLLKQLSGTKPDDQKKTKSRPKTKHCERTDDLTFPVICMKLKRMLPGFQKSTIFAPTNYEVH
jgi:hypothetical protein